ncbi:flagellar biosynthetic protein FliO [Clostridium oryzae]|uniref:Flagellar protein n=1 Tax=Clostridium oryzae TaxID=1450648 RepID=A0A1V4ITB6_9CLOT|nr:flagellar biosynthetic protein FliO [Clostridium oryzae]OPJ63268.1 hypothetical protein CLORY_13510 [Clostridium oryzae]
MESLKMVLQICLFLPFILLLVYVTLRLGGSTFKKVQDGRFIKLHEKVMLSKENSLFVAQIGERGYIISSTNGRIEILKELTEEELCKAIEKQQIPQYKNLQEFVKNFKLRRKDF